MTAQQLTSTYREFTRLTPWPRRFRAAVRDIALGALAMGRRIDSTTGWIRFPYYHHVFDDERRGFSRHLDYLGNFGDFVSLDDALALMADGGADGRYFCLGFDDGLKNCATNALPILAERGISATFYVVTSMMGRRLGADDPMARRVFGFEARDTAVPFLDWDDCRALVEAGMTIGSHSASHARLATLDDAEVRRELMDSKAAIENALGTPCHHFCPPYGKPGEDFRPDRDPALARDAGYRSLVTGVRGPSHANADPFAIRRDHLLANWGLHQLRYFLSLA